MTRTYERETIKYDFDTLVLKAAQIPPTATYFEKADVWVVKEPTGGSFKVLPHQIVGKPDIFAGAPIAEVVHVPAIGPLAGYSAQERYDGEDVGPHGAVYVNALQIATEYLRVIKDRRTDPLLLVRHILDDVEGEYTNSLNETIADALHETVAKAKAPKPAYQPLTAAQEDDLLAKFL